MIKGGNKSTFETAYKKMIQDIVTDLNDEEIVIENLEEGIQKNDKLLR